MRKSFCIILIAVLMGSLFLAATACKDKNGEKESLIKLQDYAIPQDLDDYGLTIEWLNQSGAPTAFTPQKPVVVLFEGIVPTGYKSSYTLDSSEYYYNEDNEEQSTIAEASKAMNLNLAHYWWNMGFNVGVFHYENYAVGNPIDIIKKIYHSKSVFYTNEAEQVVYPSDCEFSLTEIFVYLWLKVFEETPVVDTTTPYSSREVRFIGNSVGANLAISATDYLYAAFDEGLIPPYAVPNRVSMTNPYFSNTNIDTPIDFREETHTSPLSYNSARIVSLAEQGVVFELVESDPEFYLGYDTPYTGLVETESGTELGDTGDSAVYNEIKNQCATLHLSQTYETLFSEEYRARDRAALDWYLYSINGSDNSSLASSNYGGPNDTNPMADDIVHYVSGRLYAVSAWTPTPYIRAVRGVEYRMEEKSYNRETDEYDIIKSFTMSKFQAEAKQCSDLSESLVCGYVFFSKNNSKFMNWGADTRMSNVEIIIELENTEYPSGSGFFKIRTGRDGFYRFVLDPKYYESTITVSVILPSSMYTYSTDRQITDSFYERYTISTINRAQVNLDQSFMQNNSGLVQIFLNNCGLRLL